MIHLLFLGDIVGKPGREAVKAILPVLKKKYKPHFVIANVENIVHGSGVNREKVQEMLDAGVDGCTCGDHTFDVKAVEELLSDPKIPIIRPGNWPGEVAGRGWRIIRKGGKKLLLMNILGRVFMKLTPDDPFTCIEQMLSEASKEKYDCSFLDVHAEATSEKRAIAEAFDGKIDVIVGTHTHVQTNDPRTLLKGTGFLSDSGMCGPSNSVLGLDAQLIIQKFRTCLPCKHEVASGSCEVAGVLAHVGTKGTVMELVRREGIEVQAD